MSKISPLASLLLALGPGPRATSVGFQPFFLHTNTSSKGCPGSVPASIGYLWLFYSQLPHHQKNSLIASAVKMKRKGPALAGGIAKRQPKMRPCKANIFYKEDADNERESDIDFYREDGYSTDTNESHTDTQDVHPSACDKAKGPIGRGQSKEGSSNVTKRGARAKAEKSRDQRPPTHRYQTRLNTNGFVTQLRRSKAPSPPPREISASSPQVRIPRNERPTCDIPLPTTEVTELRRQRPSVPRRAKTDALEIIHDLYNSYSTN